MYAIYGKRQKGKTQFLRDLIRQADQEWWLAGAYCQGCHRTKIPFAAALINFNHSHVDVLLECPCHFALYCSRTCQKKHWEHHKTLCQESIWLHTLNRNILTLLGLVDHASQLPVSRFTFITRTSWKQREPERSTTYSTKLPYSSFLPSFVQHPSLF